VIDSNRQHSIIIESNPPGFGDRVVRLLLILFITGHTQEQETYLVTDAGSPDQQIFVEKG